MMTKNGEAMAHSPAPIDLRLTDGDHDGIVRAFNRNWSGVVLQFKREDFKRVCNLNETELERAGVYLLLGHEKERKKKSVYVGQSSGVRGRLSEHIRKNEWEWSNVVMVYAKDNDFNEGCWKYLETRLCNELRNIGKINVKTLKTTKKESLPSHEIDDMDEFYKRLVNFLSVVIEPVLSDDIGADIFDQRGHAPKTDDDAPDAPVFELVSRRGNHFRACGVPVRSKFVVKGGSVARKDWVGKKNVRTNGEQNREILKQDHILKPVTEGLRFTKDFTFPNPSVAAAVIVGRHEGPAVWIDKASGKTYPQWLAENQGGETE